MTDTPTPFRSRLLSLHDRLADRFGEGFEVTFEFQVGGVEDHRAGTITGGQTRTCTFQSVPLREAEAKLWPDKQLTAEMRQAKVPWGKLDSAGEVFIPRIGMKLRGGSSSQQNSMTIVEVRSFQAGNGPHKFEVLLRA